MANAISINTAVLLQLQLYLCQTIKITQFSIEHFSDIDSKIRLRFAWLHRTYYQTRYCLPPNFNSALNIVLIHS